ncbi:MAG: tetratricopeptide repeat protein [Nitrosopumilus sp.]|nr:tetratricopeptide repeat protein [Nitrosopumilus sp.]
MLGYFIGISLVLTALFPAIGVIAFAESFDAYFDKELYWTGDLLTISGKIFDYGMPIIAMSIHDPDGKILSANNLEISSEKTFSKTIQLDSPFYEKIGQYKIKLDYGQISQNYFFTIDDDITEPEIFIEEFVEPEIILLYTEKLQYTDNDVISITGLVSTLDSPTVLIGIYDPFGMPTGFYFGTVNSNLEFSTNFLVKSGVNFRVDGTYSIKAHYGESEAISFFDYYENLESVIDNSIPDEVIPDEVIPEPTIITPKEIEIITKPADDNKNSNPDSIIEVDVGKDIEKTSSTDDSSIIKTNPKKIPTKTVIEEHDNLSVEDIELGKILNQINLECDTSSLTDTITYYDGMGPALYRLCKFDISLSFFNESLIDNPNNVEILVNKGSALGKLGYYSEAITYYDHAIKLDPGFLPAKNNKANALSNLGHFNEAVMLYTEILEKNPSYLTARQNLEFTLYENSKIQNTIQPSVLKEKFENIVYEEHVENNKINSVPSEKQKPSAFFEEIGSVFSSLGSLFGFFN